MSKIKKLLHSVSFCILIFTFCILFTGCSRKVPQEKTVSEVPVRVMSVERGDLKETLFYVGDIKAKDEAVVYPKVTGKIVAKLKGEGDKVSKDEAIAYVDRDEVGFNFEKAPVKSPIKGIVGKVYVDVGTNVSPQTPIGLVVSMDAVKVKIDIVERDLPKVKVGQSAQIKVDAYPGEVFEGVVERVSPVVDLASRTSLVKVKIPNSDHRLKPGMFTRVEILTRQRKDVLIIPRDALIRESGANYVFVVRDKKVYRREIEIGLHENNRFEVAGGLNEDELVVTMGKSRLKEGDIVIIVDKLIQ